MATNNPSTHAIGWVALATGITVSLALLWLVLMYTVSMSFGAVNDVFNGLFGIFSAVLAGILYAEHRAKASRILPLAVALAILGAIFSLIGSALILYGFTGFFLAGLYSGLGNALIGLWLLAFCHSMQRRAVFSRRLILFGVVAGAVMALGLIGIPGILAGTDNMAFMPWYLYVGLSGWLGTYVLYPIWTIWLGRELLRK